MREDEISKFMGYTTWKREYLPIFDEFLKVIDDKPIIGGKWVKSRIAFDSGFQVSNFQQRM